MAETLISAFDSFLLRYQNDPVLYVREVLGAEPDPGQLRVLRAYQARKRRIGVRSGHGVGKTTVLAWIITHHLLCRFPQKTVATAPTSKQLFDALAAECKTWVKRLPQHLRERIDIKSEGLELIAAPSESFVSFRTSSIEKPEALAGVHSEWVLLIGDEASGIPEAIFEASIGSMSGANAVTILAGNPVRTSGLFFDVFHKLRGLWETVHISCLDSPRVDADFVEDVRRRYGERSNQYRVRVLGEFPLGDDDTVIPFELVEASLHRDVKPHEVQPIWGLDCARFGRDRSALARRKGNVLQRKVEAWHGLDTMELAGRIHAIWRDTPDVDRPSEICVDAIGIGSGVADRLRELGLPARAVNVSESPSLGEMYANLRSELWFNARDWFQSRDCNLAEDQNLAGELVVPKFKFRSTGKRQVEGKDDIRKRMIGGMSTDLADAFMLTFAGTAVSAIHGSNNSPSWKAPLVRVIKGLV